MMLSTSCTVLIGKNREEEKWRKWRYIKNKKKIMRICTRKKEENNREREHVLLLLPHRLRTQLHRFESFHVHRRVFDMKNLDLRFVLFEEKMSGGKVKRVSVKNIVNNTPPGSFSRSKFFPSAAHMSFSV